MFTAVADFLAWLLFYEGIQYVIHYLDDFLIFVPPGVNALLPRQIVESTFGFVNTPVTHHKTEGPSTSLTFLGIHIDSIQSQLLLPREKVDHLQIILSQWVLKRCCTRKELESVLGHLSHAATVIRPGRIFLHTLFSLLSQLSCPSHFVWLNTEARADLVWWRHLLQHWNGRSFFPLPTLSHHIYSDASSSFGCGAFLDASGGWFQLQWPALWSSTSISAKELLPIVLDAALWGSQWEGRHMCFHSDNEAVVAVVQRLYAKDKLLHSLLRCLFFYAAIFNFHFSATHIPGHLIGWQMLSPGIICHLSLLSFCRTLRSLSLHNHTLSDSPPRLGISQLDRAVHSLADLSLSPSSNRSYWLGVWRYTSFCARYQLIGFPLPDLVLCRFVAFLVQQGLAYTSICQYLCALRHHQLLERGNDPGLSSFPHLHYVLRGSHHFVGSTVRPTHLPITPAILQVLYRCWSQNAHEFNTVCYWAACCIGFFAFLRSGESTCSSWSSYDSSTLSLGDVSIDSHFQPTMVHLTLRRSKTNVFGAGVTIHLGKTESILCPVSSLLAYLAIRPATPGPLFLLHSGAPLSREILVRAVRSTLSSTGIDTSLFHGHNFRIGADTTASYSGLPDSTIKMLGRSKSSAFFVISAPLSSRWQAVPDDSLTSHDL